MRLLRGWELSHNNSIDVSDAMGSNIRIDEFNGEIKRIIPRENDKINQEWLSDKARFFYDGLRNQRLDKPFLKVSKKLVASDWKTVISKISNTIKNTETSKIAAITGSFTDLLKLCMQQKFFKSGGNNIDCRFNLSNVPIKSPSDWLFNSSIEKIDKIDKLLIIGCDPKREAAVLNAELDKDG